MPYLGNVKNMSPTDWIGLGKEEELVVDYIEDVLWYLFTISSPQWRKPRVEGGMGSKAWTPAMRAAARETKVAIWTIFAVGFGLVGLVWLVWFW